MNVRILAVSVCLFALAGCVTTRAIGPARDWDARLAELQKASSWQMNGRAAVAVGTQGWQATLDWREQPGSAELHLAGPLGIGAQVITQTAAGLSINGNRSSEAALAQLQDRLGFELPIEHLKFWLLGVPDPHGEFELTRNAQDRAQHLSQAGWSIDYDRYQAASGDVLPGRVVLVRDDVRVRIVADRWTLNP
jgi:outer membrane lipoprotein LolB